MKLHERNWLACALALALGCAAAIGPVRAQTIGTLHDVSGSIATGATSQPITVPNDYAFLFIQNPCDATEVLYLDFDKAASSTAKTSMELAACGSWDSHTFNFRPQGTINVTAATSAHKFIAKWS